MPTEDVTESHPRVLHVVHSVEPGGTERVLCRLVRAMQGRGGTHLLCGLKEPRPFSGPFAADLEAVSLQAGECDRLLFRKLARLIRTQNVDIVHARNWGTWTDAALASMLVRKVRLVLGFHGLQDRSSFTAADRRRATFLRLSRFCATAVSQAAKEKLVNELGFDRRSVFVTPNGVDTEKFVPVTAIGRQSARHRLGLRQDAFVVGSVANFFERVKGHAVLLESFSRFVAQHSDAFLLLVGYGPLEEEIRARVERLGLKDRVVFAGRVEDVQALLPAMDVFVCSSHSEGMCNAVLEAMASALPCVVTDVANHREMFSEIASELIVPVGDCDGISEQLHNLAMNTVRRADIGRLSRALVERDYTFERTVQSYSSVYSNVMRGQRTCSSAVACGGSTSLAGV